MKTAKTIWITAVSMLCIASAGRTRRPQDNSGPNRPAARARRRRYGPHGAGIVRMRVVGRRWLRSQEFRLNYPGPPLEHGARWIKIAVREDYYRSKDQ